MVAIGQIALASFPNPGGLEKVGGSLLRVTQNSGAVIAGIQRGQHLRAHVNPA